MTRAWGRWPDYHKAWQYVEAQGYKRIIEQLRKSYKGFAGQG